MSDINNDLLLELIASVATMEDKLTTSLKELSDDVRTSLESMDKKVTSLEEKLTTSLKELRDDNLLRKGDLSNATQKLKDLSTKFEENECNWKRAGDTFEIVVRRELRATKGAD
jgi:t-SNARE complex subunit (syntaxin)